MSLSTRAYVLFIAVIVMGIVRIYGGNQFFPPPPPDTAWPNDPPDVFTDPFDPVNDLPDPIDLPLPPEDPFDEPFDPIDIPLPPDLPDPFDVQPSLFPDPFDDIPEPPDVPLPDFPDLPLPPGAAIPRAQAVVATNAPAPQMAFPRPLWFSPQVTLKAPQTTLTCSATNQSHIVIPEAKRNTLLFLNTCPYASGGRVAVGRYPIAVAVTHNGQLALVSNSDDGTISVVNVASKSVVQTIALPPFNGVKMRPSGIAILPDDSKAYVTDHVDLPGSAVYVIDLSTMKVTTMLAVGGYAASIAVTPDGSQVWVSCWGGGRVEVFDTLTNASVFAYSVPAANGIAFNPTGTRAYMASGTNNTVMVADTSTYQVVAQIPVGNLPHSVRVSPTGRHLFVTNVFSNSISQIDTDTNTVIRTVTLKKAKHPLGLAFIGKAPF